MSFAGSSAAVPVTGAITVKKFPNLPRFGDQAEAAGPKRKTFIFVNNRLEGNAIGTIAAMLQAAN